MHKSGTTVRMNTCTARVPGVACKQIASRGRGRAMMREGKVERKEKRAVSGRGSKPSPQELVFCAFDGYGLTPPSRLQQASKPHSAQHNASKTWHDGGGRRAKTPTHRGVRVKLAAVPIQ
eukprot:scaffold47562_cov29-Tisochrysis_lutea.AAC.4